MGNRTKSNSSLPRARAQHRGALKKMGFFYGSALSRSGIACGRVELIPSAVIHGSAIRFTLSYHLPCRRHSRSDLQFRNYATLRRRPLEAFTKTHSTAWDSREYRGLDTESWSRSSPARRRMTEEARRGPCDALRDYAPSATQNWRMPPELSDKKERDHSVVYD